MKIAKIVEDEQLVFGWASVSADAEGRLIVDSHGDVIEPAELERAAYDFMIEARKSGERHEGDAVGDVVESVMITPQKAEAMGIEAPHTGWWIGVHIPDAEVFAKVKSGEYEMFSIEGTAVPEDVAYGSASVMPLDKQLQSDVFSMLRESGQQRWGGDEIYVYVHDFDIDDYWAVFCVDAHGKSRMVGVAFDRAEDGSITLGTDEAELERVTGYRQKATGPMAMMRRFVGRTAA